MKSATLSNTKPPRSPLATSICFSLFMFLASSQVLAAEFFVAPANGVKLTDDQSDRITRMVRQSVRNMPEHTLVESDAQADFVLYPSIVQRDTGTFLRIEKKKDNNLISVSEQAFNLDMRGENAQNVTQSAIQTDSFVSATDSQPRALANQTSPESERVFNDGGTVSGSTSPAEFGDVSSAASLTPGPSLSTGDLRAPSPRIVNGKVPGYFQIGVGPSLAMGLNSNNLLTDINVGYNYNVNERVTTKAISDFNLGLGGNAGQFINLSGGAEYYPVTNQKFTRIKPYVTGDAGYGFARNGQTHAAGSGVTVGGGAGFKFASEQLNWDINAHYALLTNTIEGQNPSVVGVRAALNF